MNIVVTLIFVMGALAAIGALGLKLWNRFPHLGVEVELDVDGQRTGEHRSGTIWLRNRGSEPIAVHGVEFETNNWLPNFGLGQARSFISALDLRPQFPISIDARLERKWIHFSLTDLSSHVKAAGGGPTVLVRPVIQFNHNRRKRGRWFRLFVDNWAWQDIVRGQGNFDPPDAEMAA